MDRASITILIYYRRRAGFSLRARIAIDACVDHVGGVENLPNIFAALGSLQLPLDQEVADLITAYLLDAVVK